MEEAEFALPSETDSFSPKIGLVLGSGLGGFTDSLSDSLSIPYSDIEGLPESGAPGHAGQLHFGTLAGSEIVAAQGRVHIYEGWSAKEVASTVRLFHQIGVRTIILTNAAGIVNANLKPGRWMLISDHLNLARQSPLTGAATFIDQTDVYSRSLREFLKAEASEMEDFRLSEGVYAWVNGPEYETPAEVRMLRTLGADAVGMSTVPEAIQARALGMRVIGLSCLTNYGAGLSGQPLSHDEVVEVGMQAAKDLFRLLERAVPAMGEV
ncbi:MAG: purine-nucleoside phosphorylase [Verrucomicrobiales bacterium]|nr:purine-nucleoside phosphorylase [Verrucomicrobiales bacterium]